jgi:surface-anchored protein
LQIVIAVMAVLLALVWAPPPAAAAGTRVTLNPTGGPPGTEVVVAGEGYASNRNDLQLWWDGTRLPGDVASNSVGQVSTKFTVPTWAGKGLVPVYLVDGQNRASQPFDVTTPAHPNPDPNSHPNPHPNPGGSETRADLEPTAITYRQPVRAGRPVHFDSGVRNRGATDSPVFNIKWYVDGREVGAYGSHAGVSKNTVVLNGNSQFDWTFTRPGRHTVTFRVDADNHVVESDEANNTRAVRVVVVPRRR